MEKIKLSGMLTTAITGYPAEYFHFSSSVDVNDYTICSFIREGVETAMDRLIKGNLKESFSSISTGNSKVFTEVYLQDNGLYTIYVSVSKNYRQMSFCDVEGY